VAPILCDAANSDRNSSFFASRARSAASGRSSAFAAALVDATSCSTRDCASIACDHSRSIDVHSIALTDYGRERESQ
jgi:hypothetical protein